jgi:hypothetical protein
MTKTAFSAFACTMMLGALAAALPLPASAQTGSSSGAFDADRKVTRIHQKDLVALVTARGGTVISEKMEGSVSLKAKASDGLVYNLIGAVCDLPNYGPGCLGLEMQVRYDADDRVTMENINTANRAWSMTKAFHGPNENGTMTVFITYYAIVDAGQTMGNLDAALRNVLSIAPQAANVIWP